MAKESYSDKLDKMSFDELKELADKELEKYQSNDKYRQCWSITAQHAAIDSLRRRVRPIFTRMYKDDSEGLKKAMDKLPFYIRYKKTEDEKIEGLCDSLLKAEIEDPKGRIFLGNLYRKDRSR